MTDTLVERARELADEFFGDDFIRGRDLLLECASRIESLEKERNNLSHELKWEQDTLRQELEQAKAEVERLRCQRDDFRNRLNKADMLCEGELDDD